MLDPIYLAAKTISIDLESYQHLREMKRGPSPGHYVLSAQASARAFLSWTVAGEFAECFGDIGHPACAGMLDRFEILPMDRNTAHRYAVITGQLRKQNQLIGTNDHWIAAAALSHDIPLVTRNTTHFQRIPGLAVIS